MSQWTLITADHLASANEHLLVNNPTGSIIVRLPANPTVGDEVVIADNYNFSVNPVNVFPNGSVIAGVPGTSVLQQAGSHTSFIFDGAVWNKYILSLPQTKLSDLSEVSFSGVSNNDVLLYVDTETQQTMKIRVSSIADFTTADVIKTPSQVISIINSANSSSGLNVNVFGGQTPAYYRNYVNLTNRPSIPARTSDLINDGMLLTGAAPFIVNLNSFSTNHLAEGSNNRYFTNERFDSRFNIKFPELFSLYTSDFQEARKTDSEYNVPATAATTTVASNILVLPAEYIARFPANEDIRIFGADEIDTDLLTQPSFTSLTKRNLAGSANNNVSYKLASFSYTTGKVSAATAASNTIYIGTNTLDSFNNVNNIEIVLSRPSSDHGVLVYRKYNAGTFNLIDVLGPKTLGVSNLTNILYRDFGNFDNNSWNGKNSFGELVSSSGIVHMPLIAPVAPQRGWVDTKVSSADLASRTITLSESFYMDSNVIVSHNDTPAIQLAIDTRVAAGIKTLTLIDRKYIISSLTLPPTGNFTLKGGGRQTELVKLPWSTENHKKIIYALGTNTENIAISDMRINGNMQNQFLDYDDGSAVDANYAISISGQYTTLERISVENVIGGGLYSFQPSKLSVNLCRFENSGLSDFFAFSPLYAPGGSDILITNNVFRNFSDSLDLSTTDDGIFTGNLVENTGSGLLLYGSRFFISNPNVFKGPSGEFIASPDITNSEYDSVNITLEANTAYMSPSFVYQENGEVFSLVANEGSIQYRINRLGLFNNVEQLYDTVPNYINDVVGPDKSLGEFSFSIPRASVEQLMTTYSYSTLKSANTGHVGLVYRAIQSEVVPSGTVVGSGTINPSALGADKYRVTLTNYSNLAVGRPVVFGNHGGVIGVNTLNNTEGVILSITENTNVVPREAYVTIDYTANVVSTGVGGSLKVKNEFVLAKGRIV